MSKFSDVSIHWFTFWVVWIRFVILSICNTFCASVPAIWRNTKHWIFSVFPITPAAPVYISYAVYQFLQFVAKFPSMFSGGGGLTLVKTLLMTFYIWHHVMNWTPWAWVEDWILLAHHLTIVMWASTGQGDHSYFCAVHYTIHYRLGLSPLILYIIQLSWCNWDTVAMA